MLDTAALLVGASGALGGSCKLIVIGVVVSRIGTVSQSCGSLSIAFSFNLFTAIGQWVGAADSIGAVIAMLPYANPPLGAPSKVTYFNPLNFFSK